MYIKYILNIYIYIYIYIIYIYIYIYIYISYNLDSTYKLDNKMIAHINIDCVI